MAVVLESTLTALVDCYVGVYGANSLDPLGLGAMKPAPAASDAPVLDEPDDGSP